MGTPVANEINGTQYIVKQRVINWDILYTQYSIIIIYQ